MTRQRPRASNTPLAEGEHSIDRARSHPVKSPGGGDDLLVAGAALLSVGGHASSSQVVGSTRQRMDRGPRRGSPIYALATPTGPKHTHSYDETSMDGTEALVTEPCRCTIGEDHHDSDMLSATEAEDIWLLSGMDEDYDFR